MSTAENYIMYRTKALMFQSAYSYLEGETPVVPAAVVASPTGIVIATQQLMALTGIIVPDGIAYALDKAGTYPVGSTYTPATSYALAGSGTGTVAVAMTLTLTPNNDGPNADTTVTLSDGSAGGTFSADTVTFDGCTNTAQTVTYTPKAAGAVTISATNADGLTNPSSLSVTVSAAAS